MPTSRSIRRVRLAALVSAALAITGFQNCLFPQAAEAVGTSLVINEVYGAGGNSGATYNADFVELKNIGTSSASLNGMSIQYRSATGTSAQVANLSGAVDAGATYLIRMSATGANGVALPTPDAVASPAIAMGGGAGVVILANSTTGFTAQGSIIDNPAVMDLVGYGSTATTFESAPTGVDLTSTTSAQRSATGADTDHNGTDFSEALPTPTNSNPGPAPLSLAAISNQNSVVGTPITTVQPSATGGVTPYTWSASGLPAGIGIDPGTGAISGTPSASCTCNVQVTVEDSANPTHATASRSFTWNVSAGVVVRPIKEIQGTGDASPFANQSVTTEGKVTASYPTGGLNGFYLQSTTADDPNASDALFVFGGAGFTAFPSVGDSVRVTGVISEFNGLTEMTIANDSDLSDVADLGTVPVKTQVPDTNCAVGACPATAAALNSGREASEGELFQPTAAWTATDVYDGAPRYNNGSNGTSNFGEIGLAADSSKPLVAPTEIIDAQATAQIADRTAWNNAHRIILDDGSSRNYTTTNKNDPAPWQTLSYVPRVGSAVSFPAPVVLTWGFDQWRIEPTTMVTGAPDPATQPQFSDTRTPNATPQDVGGDLKLATFNVLNFFPTTGVEYVAGGGSCTYYNDRDGNHVTVNDCGPNGPRGAADPTNLQRQRDKIVAAINTANADIVSLEELENSVKFGKDRDFAITELVNALNAASTPGTWAFAPSPAPADLPDLAEQDVIRTGFIFQPARVALVGASKVLVGSAPFSNAREPLAQAFKKAGSPDSSAFAVIVNHFKSKGSGVDDGTGQGNANPDRIAQANALAAFADDFKAQRSISKVFLVGDFNAYSEEDPIQALEAAGYTSVNSTSDPDEETYNFDGQIGSLDHVLANAEALGDVSGADVWPINGYESVYYEYSRFNYNATNLYDTSPFRSSDHSPEIVGVNVSAKATPVLSVSDVTVEYGQAASVTVHVDAPGTTPTGTVTIKDGATTIGTGRVRHGKATVVLPPRSLPVGTSTLTAEYSGDDQVDGATQTFSVTVTKAGSATSATVQPSQPQAGDKVKVKITVAGANGVEATGQVTVRMDGVSLTVFLQDGKATANLGKLNRGQYTVNVHYTGSAVLTDSRARVRFTVY